MSNALLNVRIEEIGVENVKSFGRHAINVNVCAFCGRHLPAPQPFFRVTEGPLAKYFTCALCIYTLPIKQCQYFEVNTTEAVSDFMAENLVIEVNPALKATKPRKRERARIDLDRYVLLDEDGKPYGLRIPSAMVHGHIFYITRPDVLANTSMASNANPIFYYPASLSVPPRINLSDRKEKYIEPILCESIFEDYMKRYGLKWYRCRFFMSRERFDALRNANRAFVYRNAISLLKHALSWACPLRLKLARRFSMRIRYRIYWLACRHYRFVELISQAPLLAAYLVRYHYNENMWRHIDMMVHNGVDFETIAHEVGCPQLATAKVSPSLAFHLIEVAPLVAYGKLFDWVASLSKLPQQRVLVHALRLHSHLNLDLDLSHPFWSWLHTQVRDSDLYRRPVQNVFKDLQYIVHFMFCRNEEHRQKTQTFIPNFKPSFDELVDLIKKYERCNYIVNAMLFRDDDIDL